MRLAALSTATLVWAFALYATTQVHTLGVLTGHSICGPWGCAAATESLVGYHLFWLVLLAPLVTLTCRALPRGSALRLSRGLAGVGAVAASAVVVGSAIAWLRDGGAVEYALQRGLFVLAATPDAPLLQVALAGGLGRLVVRRRAAAVQRGVEEGALSRENQVV